MRILFVGMDATLYGDRSLEVRVADELARRGHEVHLVTERMPRYGEGEHPETMEHYVMPVNRGLGVADKGRLFESHPAVIFGSSASALPLITELASKLGVPSLCQFLDIPVWRLKYDHWRKEWEPRFQAARDLDGIVVNHTPALQAVREFVGNEVPIHRIVYGMDSETADAVEPQQDGEDYAIMVSRLVWYKGVDQLLYALRGDSQMTVRIIGDGPEAFRLRETALMAGVRAEFLGPVSDREKFALIKGAKFGVYPNICEFIGGLFPLEALYCGIPCIVYDLPVSREIYEENVHYVRAYDIGRLWKVMKFHWSWDLSPQNLPAPNVQKAQAFIQKKRTFQSQAEELEKVLREAS